MLDGRFPKVGSIFGGAFQYISIWMSKVYIGVISIGLFWKLVQSNRDMIVASYGGHGNDIGRCIMWLDLDLRCCRYRSKLWIKKEVQVSTTAYK
jgi:hypothetical protein